MGDYGIVNPETGGLWVQGNIYDSEFQAALDRLGLDFRVADHPPQVGPVEDDFIFAPKGVKRVDLELGAYVSLFTP